MHTYWLILSSQDDLFQMTSSQGGSQSIRHGEDIHRESHESRLQLTVLLYSGGDKREQGV